MKRSKPLRRTAFKAKAPAQAKPRSRLRARSAKREALYAGTPDQEGRRAFVARMLGKRPVCEAGVRIGLRLRSAVLKSVDPGLSPDGIGTATKVWVHCEVASVDVHEILARSAGGSILDEGNVLCLCRQCHDWIGNNPKAALELGLRKSRYEGRNPS